MVGDRMEDAVILCKSPGVLAGLPFISKYNSLTFSDKNIRENNMNINYFSNNVAPGMIIVIWTQ